MKLSLFVWSTSLVVVCTLVIGSESSGLTLPEKAFHDSRCSVTERTESVTVTLSLETNCNLERTATVNSAKFNVCESNGCENKDVPHGTPGYKTTHNCCVPVPKADAQDSNGDYVAPFRWTVVEYTDVAITGGCASNPGTTEVYIVSPTACQCVFLDYEDED